MSKLGSLYGDTIYRKIVVKNYIIIYYIIFMGILQEKDLKLSYM